MPTLNDLVAAEADLRRLREALEKIVAQDVPGVERGALAAIARNALAETR